MSITNTNTAQLLRALLKAGVSIRLSAKATQVPLYHAQQVAKELNHRGQLTQIGYLSPQPGSIHPRIHPNLHLLDSAAAA